MNKLIWIFLVGCICSVAKAQDPSAACYQQLGGDERFQLLFKKAPLDISKGQSLEVMANQSKATSKEKAALSILVSEIDKCTEIGAEWRNQNYPPSINAYSSSYQSFLRSALADLYAGKVTFGDFAKIRDKEFTELRNKIAFERQQIQAQREMEKRKQELAARSAAEDQRRYVEQQEMQADESRRQAALQLLLNQRQTQPYQIQPYQMPTPRTTNCNTFGNQTNCTTK